MNDITKWFRLQSELLQKNAEIIDNRNGKLQILRIDNIVPPKFIPRMPLSSMDGEDITTPRVCVSLSLLECLAGIKRIFEDTFRFNSYKVDNPFLGGYVISELDADYFIKPNSKLVPDAEQTNEHWLIGFNKDHLEYKPKKLGELFCTELHVYPITKGDKRHAITEFKFVVRINDNSEHIQVSPNSNVNYNYFTFTFEFNCIKDVSSNDEIKNIIKLDKEEYDKLKKRSAALLNFDLRTKKELLPSLKW